MNKGMSSAARKNTYLTVSARIYIPLKQYICAPAARRELCVRAECQVRRISFEVSLRGLPKTPSHRPQSRHASALYMPFSLAASAGAPGGLLEIHFLAPLNAHTHTYKMSH